MSIWKRRKQAAAAVQTAPEPDPSRATVEIPEVCNAHVQTGRLGARVTQLQLAPEWSCRFIQTSPPSRRQRIPTAWSDAVRLSFRGPRQASDWTITIHHDDEGEAQVVTSESWVQTPPLTLECPGGSVQFVGDGDHETVRVAEVVVADGWTTAPISNVRLRGEHEAGITFANGVVEWLLSVTGYDGEGPAQARCGHRRRLTA